VWFGWLHAKAAIVFSAREPAAVRERQLLEERPRAEVQPTRNARAAHLCTVSALGSFSRRISSVRTGGVASISASRAWCAAMSTWRRRGGGEV